MLLVFSLFLVDTKKIYGYNVVAPLRLLLRGETHFLRSEFGKKKNWLIAFPYYHYKTNKFKQLDIMNKSVKVYFRVSRFYHKTM